MWPQMQGFGFSPMFGMGGGFGGIAAGWGGNPSGGYGGGYDQYAANRAAAGGNGGYMPPPVQPGMYDVNGNLAQPTGAQRGDARLGRITNRIGNLQEQYKGADTTQQAGIQGRIDTLQGRAKNLRADRRRGNGLYEQGAPGAQPEPGMMGGFQPSQYGGPPMVNMLGRGYGGMPEPGMYGGGYGGYAPRPLAGYGAPQGASTGQREAQGSQGGPAQNPGQGFGRAPVTSYTGAYESGNYGSPFGQLVQSNSGQGHLAKSINGGDQQYGFNGQSWQVANDQNMGSFVDPYQYAQQAGAQRAQYSRRGNFLAADPNSGTYR